MISHLFFMDIDGTLCRGDSVIRQEVLDAAGAFREKGGEIVLCTGRSPMSARRIAERLAISLPCIVYCGAMLYDFKAGRRLASHAMNGAVLADIRRMLEAFPQISLMAYTADQVYLLRSTVFFRANGVQDEIPPAVSRLEDMEGQIFKIVLSCEEPLFLRQCHEQCFGGPDYQFEFSGREFADIVAGGVTKADMMDRLLALLRIPVSRTFAAGDAMTDYTMLKASGYSFAPVDADSGVLAVCDEIIPRCEDNGAATALKSALKMIGRSSHSQLPAN